MSHFTLKQRLKIAFGGFMLLIGFTILILTFLIIVKTLNVEDFLQSNLLVYLVAVVGALEVLGGVLLLRSR